jgi:phosphoglycolate phosphatase-like HAD superfamily hydrolase
MLGIAFALRGTLVDDRGLARATLVELAAEVLAQHASGRHEPSPEALADRILADAPVTVTGIGTALAEVAGAPSAKRVARAFSARYRQLGAALAPDYLIPRDGAIDTLREVSRLRVPSAILTSAIGSVASRAASLTGFDGRVLAAEDIGAAKPAAEAYSALARALGLPANVIYYVSADPFDIAAANACGLTTVFLDGARRALRTGVMAPAHTIESLPELLPIVAGPYTRGLLALRYVAHGALAWRPGHFVPGAEYGPDTPEADG